MTKDLIVVIAVLDSLILYCIYREVKELIKRKRLEIERMKNLLRQSIELELNEDEAEMLSSLSRGDYKRYLRKKVKELCKN